MMMFRLNRNRPVMSKQHLEACTGELHNLGVVMCIEFIKLNNDAEECSTRF